MNSENVQSRPMKQIREIQRREQNENSGNREGTTQQGKSDLYKSAPRANLQMDKRVSLENKQGSKIRTRPDLNKRAGIMQKTEENEGKK